MKTNTPSSHPLYATAEAARRQVALGSVSGALSALHAGVDSRPGLKSVKDSISSIETKYNTVKTAWLGGATTAEEVTPGYDRLLLELDDLIERLERQVLSIDAPTLYFNTVRYLRTKPDTSFATLHASLDHAVAEHSASPSRFTRLHLEEVTRDLFLRLWTGHPLSAGAIDEVTLIILDPRYSVEMRCQLVSAMTLGLIEYYDENRLLKLLDIYFSADVPRVALRALTGFMLAMHRYRYRPHSDNLLSKIELLSFNPDWDTDRDMVFEQLIRTVDTDRISRRLKEEFLPGLMKMKSFLDGINADSETDPEALLEDNPEWERIMHESGLQERMIELSELQEQGSDVFMGTFSSLKHFPFFNSIENWFSPYTTDRSDFDNPRYEPIRNVLEAIGTAPVLCDNDKFSMALAMAGISDAQRSMIADRMKAEGAQLESIAATELLPEAARRKDIVNKYIQDLYRFYTLFNRAKEMTNPFEEPFNLLKIKSLSMMRPSTETLQVVGSFYLHHHLYSDALAVYELLEKENPLSMDILQKEGHCLHRMGNLQRAIECLDKADIIGSDDPWTLRNLGACLAAAGDSERAIAIYRRALDTPSGETDLRVYRALADLYIKRGEIDAMRGLLESARFKGVLNSASGQLLEARSLSFTPDFMSALETYRRLSFDGAKLTAFDLSARGCCEWLAGFREDAIDTWRAALSMPPFKDAPNRREAFDAMIHPAIPAQFPDAIPVIVDLVLRDV